MLTHNLGYPRIGSQRELKHACESFWAGKTSIHQLQQVGRDIRQANWLLQENAGIDLIPSNDFSFYDHVLDTSLMVGNIPGRFKPLLDATQGPLQYLYFAMARGYQDSALDITALEMTKWFDTNYHYLVPEFTRDQTFELFSGKVIEEFIEAKDMGIITKPVILGPVSYLLLGKEKERGFHRLDLLEYLLPVYCEVLKLLHDVGAGWVQLDEPCLVADVDPRVQTAIARAYGSINAAVPRLKIILATYFGPLHGNMDVALSLPVHTLHVDLSRAPEQLPELLGKFPAHLGLSMGLVDGRNIWINNYNSSLDLVDKALDALGDRLMIAPSCSLLHVPCDLDLENDEGCLPGDVRSWMAFARQKLSEVRELARLRSTPAGPADGDYGNALKNVRDIACREQSLLVHDAGVQKRLSDASPGDYKRALPYPARRSLQQHHLKLPLFPTTTIGSFPQTREVRELRGMLREGRVTPGQYEQGMKDAIEKAVRWQEEIGLDVLVHGEFERNDMVEYFGQQLRGFAFTRNGWVQSYGSRCVKPPVIYGDVSRPAPMTVGWITFAQSLTSKPVKGMCSPGRSPSCNGRSPGTTSHVPRPPCKLPSPSATRSSTWNGPGSPSYR